MKLRNRDIGERANTSLAKKRKLHDPQDPRTPGDVTVELGRGKRSKPAPKRKPAVQPIEQEIGPEPTGERELLVEPPAGDVDDESDDESSRIEERIIEELSNAPLPRYLKSGRNEPMPLSFQRELREERERGNLSEGAEQYYLDLRHGDIDRRNGANPSQSLLEDVLKTNPEREREETQQPCKVYPRRDDENEVGSKALGWKIVKGISKISTAVNLWEKARRDGPPLQIAAKDASRTPWFYKTYNNEGNLIRRLNYVGCKNVIKVLDWFLVYNRYGDTGFRTCLEFAEFGDLGELAGWYRNKKLVLPEAFVWHVFYSLANALCYCRHGTNRPRSGTHGLKDWDRIVHDDLRLKNILLAAPDNDCHRLYPCLKLADFEDAFTLGEPISEVVRYRNTWRLREPDRIHAPEVLVPEDIPSDRSPRPGEFHDSYSDVYSLGIIMADLCRPVHIHLPMPIQKFLLQDDCELGSGMRKVEGREVNPSGHRILSSYYSTQLKELIRRCRSENPLERPSVYKLYRETKSAMEAFRDRAYREEKNSPAPIVDGIAISHSKVLYTQAEKELFNSDDHEEFKSAYRVANLTPVWGADGKKVKRGGVREWTEKMLKDIDPSITSAIPHWYETSFRDDYGLPEK